MRLIPFQQTRKHRKERFGIKNICPIQCITIFSIIVTYAVLLTCILFLLLPDTICEPLLARSIALKLLDSFFRVVSLSSVFICITAILKKKYHNT